MPEIDAIPPPRGHFRARRRGSIVKTNLNDESNNVDGDGEHIAKASMQSTEVDSTTASKDWSLVKGLHQKKEVVSSDENHKVQQRRCSTGGMKYDVLTSHPTNR